ncbi:hypothetical protein HPB48_002458 [Haemaphysalis longicornis]|uniref:Uncharacterized protein n=1 Tax=Haemaphysalis longicornis TaxID=44386 RepID=A0A9J6FVV6_HAELO|nr:hypothetical protein HPB48_002458 [Haemaphysalis longicornis]
MSVSETLTVVQDAWRVEAALIMFKRSLSKNGLQYTTVMSDGDSRTMHGLKEKGVYGFIP